MSQSMASFENGLAGKSELANDRPHPLGQLLNSTISTHARVFKENANVDGIWKLSLTLRCLKDMFKCLEATSNRGDKHACRAHVLLTRFFYEAFFEMQEFLNCPKDGIRLLAEISKKIPREQWGEALIEIELDGRKKSLLQDRLFAQVGIAFREVYGELLELGAAINMGENHAETFPEFVHDSTRKVFKVLLGLDDVITAVTIAIRLSVDPNTIRKARIELRQLSMLVERPNKGFMLKPEIVARYR